MSNFISDNTTLPYPKDRVRSAPAGQENRYIGKDDWNTVCQALIDVKSFLRGNSKLYTDDAGSLVSVKAHAGTPVAVVTAEKGSLCVDITNAKLYQNTDGATAWVLIEPASGLATIATSGSASDLGAGTVPAARMPALTGDVTTSAGAVATSIAANAVVTAKIADGNVTLAKMADLANGKIIGRNTAGTGVPEALTTVPTAAMPAHTGDVTSSAGSLALSIAANAVVTAKIADANVTAAKLAATAVTPGAYTNVSATVDQQGRITLMSSGLAPLLFSVSVKASPYNAAGDGVADDATAIGSAITAAIAANLSVYFPAGTYLINSLISFTATSGLTLFGANRAATIRFGSAAGTPRNAFKLITGSKNVEFHDLFFQGDSSDDKDVNLGIAIELDNGGGITTDLGVMDTMVHHCTFDHCTAVGVDDSFVTRRLHFYKNYVHNVPNGVHPPSDSTIEDCDFVNDAYVSTRAEFIYQYGQQTGLHVVNCKFRNGTAQDIQIRATNGRFNQRYDFRIEGCHFENSRQYSIWAGADDKPDITDFIISGNTFRNCNVPINLRGGGVINANNFMWDWECPYYASFTQGTGAAISITGGTGASGSRSDIHGVTVTGNRMVHRHPFVGKISIDTLPSAGDTITVGAFVYTWRASASTEGEVTIGGTTTTAATNLTASIRGADGIAIAPNNVLRNVNDCFCNPVNSGESNQNLVFVTSFDSFTMSKTGSHVTVDATAIDYRQAAWFGINISNIIAPHVADNLAQDFVVHTAVAYSVTPTIYDNTLSMGRQNGNTGWMCLYNNRPHWKGNRTAIQYPRDSNIGAYPIGNSAFPVYEDHASSYPRQLGIAQLQGRTGVVTVGNGKAYTYLYYGFELTGTITAYTRPWRWDEGDQLALAGGDTFTFKRSSPGALQFNDADSLVALINASGFFRASYETVINDYAGTPPKMYIKIEAVAAGTAYNNFAVIPARYKKPGDTSTFGVEHFLNALILHDSNVYYAKIHGGCDGTSGGLGATKTYVMSPIVDAGRGVFVQGADAASHALDPVVYPDDIIPGVGFLVTHAPSISGTESFIYRVN